LLLEAKLAYVSKHLLAEKNTESREETAVNLERRARPIKSRKPRYTTTYVTIGSLNYDGFLSQEQARTASRILTLSEDEFARLGEDTAKAFFDHASVFVRSFRIIVLEGLVRKTLQDKSWSVTEDAIEVTGIRGLVTESAGIRLLIVPVLDVSGSPATVDKAIQGLARLPLTSRQTVIVVPNEARTGPNRLEQDPLVVKVADLAAALESY
jgi:hypothetical protein